MKQRATGAGADRFFGKSNIELARQIGGNRLDNFAQPIGQMPAQEQNFFHPEARDFLHLPGQERSPADRQRGLGGFGGNRPEPRGQPTGEDRHLPDCRLHAPPNSARTMTRPGRSMKR